MSVYFEKTSSSAPPIISDPLIDWHFTHGAVYNLYHVSDDNHIEYPLGCIYLTLLCGSGAFIHIKPIPGNFTKSDISLVCRKISSLIAPAFDVLFATIPPDCHALIHLAQRIGFRPVHDGDFPGFTLLKYFFP